MPAPINPDYKAIVACWLYGGNDHNDTYVPFDDESNTAYQNLRPSLARDYNTLIPVGADRNGREIAFTPEWADMKGLWDQKKIAILANVGTLKVPLTKAEFLANPGDRPSQLFSHNDQQSTWQSSFPVGATRGWHGLLGDLYFSQNGAQSVFTSVSTGGSAVLMTGNAVRIYRMNPDGLVFLSQLWGNSDILDSITEIITSSTGGQWQASHAQITSQALSSSVTLQAALDDVGVSGVSFRTGAKKLGPQLAMIARLVDAGRRTLGLTRQVFHVSMGGYDTHTQQLAARPALLTELNNGLVDFQASMEAIGADKQVTLYTASDFGRTLTPNNDGTDHGWGSHHLIMGGAVEGGKIYGDLPIVAQDGPDDVGRGRLRPTTSVYQYTATLAAWFGAPDDYMPVIAPGIDNFETRNLGFMGQSAPLGYVIPQAGGTPIPILRQYLGALERGKAYVGDNLIVNRFVEEPPPPATVPDQIGPLTITPGDGQATIDWDPPFDGGSPIIRYDLNLNGTLISDVQRPYVATGLDNNATHTVRVRAVNAIGPGAYTSAQTFTTQGSSVYMEGFNRGDALGWGPDLTWTEDGTPTNASSTVSNQGRIYRDGLMVVKGLGIGPNQYAQGTAIYGVGGLAQNGLVIRRTGTGIGTFYFAAYRQSDGRVTLYKIVNGVATDLGVAAGAMTNGAVLAISAVDTQIRVFVDNVEVVSVTDSSITGDGDVGAWCGLVGSAGNHGLWDDMEFGPLS